MALTASERQARYKERHPDRVRTANRSWKQRNRDRLQRDGRRRERQRRERARLAVITAFGSKCAECGFSDIRALHIDHVNGGGLREWRAFNMDAVKYQRHVALLATSGKYQLLCANHNQIKEWERRRRERKI